MHENELQHSARGTHWTKKDHKYLRKEGNKYIYDDKKVDAVKGATKTAAATYLKNYAADHLLPSQYRRYYNAGKQLNRAYQVVKKTPEVVEQNERHRAVKRKLDTIERLNQMEKEKKQAAERKVADAARAQRKEQQQKALLKAKNEREQKELLERANRNRLNSSVRGGRTARDILSEKKTQRVIYQDGKDQNGNPMRMKRTVSNKPTYDDRGFKTSSATVNDEVVSRSVNHPGGTARDMIARKGTRRVQYKDKPGNKRYRVVTDKNYNEISRRVEHWMGQPDNRSYLKKSLDKVKSKINRGKSFIDLLLHGTKADRQNGIPTSMRLKRDLKKLRKK